MIQNRGNCCAVNRSLSFVGLEALKRTSIEELGRAIFRSGDQETEILGKLHIIDGLLML